MRPWSAGVASAATALAVLGVGGCGSSAVGAGASAAGADGYTPPLLVTPSSAPAVVAASPPVSFGGQPAVRPRLVSGATPGATRLVRVRATTWPKHHLSALFALAHGGYEIEWVIHPEFAPKGRSYRPCSVTLAVRAPGGALLYRRPAQPAGRGAATFVVPADTRARVVGTGPVGCNWSTVIFPA